MEREEYLRKMDLQETSLGRHVLTNKYIKLLEEYVAISKKKSCDTCGYKSFCHAFKTLDDNYLDVMSCADYTIEVSA